MSKNAEPCSCHNKSCQKQRFDGRNVRASLDLCMHFYVGVYARQLLVLSSGAILLVVAQSRGRESVDVLCAVHCAQRKYRVHACVTGVYPFD